MSLFKRRPKITIWDILKKPQLIPFCFALAFICFWLNLIVQFTSEFSLSCTNLCKLNTGDSDHIIS